MATWTKSELASGVLEYLEVLAAGESPAAEDKNLVQSIIDSVHDQVRKMGLAPFATSSIPMWAQQPMVKVVGKEAAPYFGFKGQALAEKVGAGADGVRDLGKQVSADKRNVPIRANYY